MIKVRVRGKGLGFSMKDRATVKVRSRAKG